MQLPYHLIDAFTDQPFSGNPAAVFKLSAPLSDTLMQAIAAEMNLSETAFVYQGEADLTLRWFTPVAEVDLCGHATLAAAFVLFSAFSKHFSGQVCFQTRSGPLVCDQTSEGITLDFPATPPQPQAVESDVINALGLTTVRYFGRSTFDYLIEVESESILVGLEPDFNQLQRKATRGFIVTAKSQEAGLDFVSRFFAPKYGVNEDPVTGSAHCCLAPFWSAKTRRSTLSAAQRSKRGGQLHLQMAGDRVLISGRAVRVAEGMLTI
jgi:PhzF family phenazine biosynthesis protein